MSNEKSKDKFENLLSGVVNKLDQNRVAPYRPTISTEPLQRHADNKRVIEELLASSDEATSFESGDELTYLRDGYQPRLLKRLRRGEFSIQDELDLHGMIVADAKEQTHYFINECARDKVRAVRIVHGKGLNSRGRKPVIKNLLLGWLRKNKHVVAVCSTPANDGGTGAVYVLLQ